jgi:hypothetical protein
MARQRSARQEERREPRTSSVSTVRKRDIVVLSHDVARMLSQIDAYGLADVF